MSLVTLTRFSALIFVSRYVHVVRFTSLHVLTRHLLILLVSYSAVVRGSYLSFDCASVYGYLQYPHCSRPDAVIMLLPPIAIVSREHSPTRDHSDERFTVRRFCQLELRMLHHRERTTIIGLLNHPSQQCQGNGVGDS